MSWLDQQAAIAAAVTSSHGFGEPVVLPSGTVSGVLDLYPQESVEAARLPGGVALGIPQQLRPVLYLQAGDAEGLAERDTVEARGVAYFVVHRDADDGGLVRVELMRKPDDADATQHDRWQ